ncbi:hypothetical protein JCM31826_14420 [Thermaurantimonas aggregans]|uniref:Lipocalin-like domain-containing protein n=1 Tax=Thermaurantimonas aggregans TaxID=2173829 RepID=A0A401XLT1_9FLAO|nr:hypothetical protein [Thermaurantimonas aggregans]MCX8147790.1 hypothetical protein [Thermaurantimonas aggregans]GCD77960.1 hypothetical protein JCM31826_14420 [Thermaurantimonas aggregans]
MKKYKNFVLLALFTASALVGCQKQDDNNDDNTNQLVGIQGKWQSSKSNVAPLLVTLFQIDSIYAEFNTNNTYEVRQWNRDGVQLPTLTGTYTQTKSNVGNIWTIRVEQTAPSALISEGIFEITGNTMKYEIVQTQPDIQAVPPTPQGGFGSTNGGALGQANVQTYVRVP